MNISMMRDEIAKVYPGDNWKTTVKTMGDKQIYAIYKTFLEEGKFDKFNERKKELKEWEQLTMF